MFWRFGGYASISSIDTLLDKPHVSLEELLDESELIQELKQHNTKLIEYLRDDNVLKRLMDYVIAPSLVNDDDDDDDENEPNDSNAAPASKDASAEEEKRGDPLKDLLGPEDLDKAEKDRLKRAYVACEILSSEIWSILESIMLNPGYLRDFWSFVRRSPPLDSVQASYFTKVNETLFDKKTSDMLEFFKSLDGIIPAILQHVDNPMVMDLLLKIISLEKAEGGQGIVDWLQTQDLIPILLSFLSTDRPASVQTSAGDFLKAIITISANATQNDQSCIGPNSLTRQLVSQSCMESLINAMLQGGNPLTVGVGIVIEVIRKNNSDYDPDNINGPDSMPTTYDPIYLGNLLRLFAKHIPDFMALIQSSKHTVSDGGEVKSVERGRLTSAWGAKIEPLGFDRFKTCELMAELLHCSNMGLLNEPGSDEYVQQRDAERERLVREGVFNPHQEGFGFDGNDSTADFVNGSVIGDGTTEDSKVLESSANTGEDGFEDVSSSGVLIDKEKDASDEKTPSAQEPASQNATSQTEEESSSASEQATAKASETKSQDQKDTANTDTTQTDTPPSDPMSPTASGLTDCIGEVSLDNQSPKDTSKETKSGETTTAPQSEQGQKPASAPMASNPEAVPPPLFAAKSQSPEDNTPSPDTAGQVGDASGPAESAPQSTSQETQEEFQHHLHPDVQVDPSGRPVVGDYLKLMFVKNRVVPTILDFFFRFPWNNFLHNVVYDIIQQVFNGPMERGYNRALAVDVFETGRITQEIVDGQIRSDAAQRAKKIRLGYMGHLTLIAEEVVKFSERHPPELLSPTVMEHVLNPEWIEYVEQTLSETRERDNAILGGVRPDMSVGSRQGMLNSGQSMNASSALADAGLNGAAGGSNFQGFDMNQGSVSGGAFGLGAGGGSSLLSGFASSSDDDEDEEMEDQEDRNSGEQPAEGSSENASSQPIPILPPPPAPLSLGPSRARRQLAARLALQKQQAAENSDNKDEDKQAGTHENTDSQWPSNPFVIAGLEDDGEGADSPARSAFPSTDFAPTHKDEAFSSPTFPESGFSPPDSLSTNSSDDDGEGQSQGGRRKERVPLEVDDDDDDMGEMVGPSLGSDMMDSDEEDEAIINESLGYPNLGPGRYKNFRRSRSGESPFGDEQDDSSDGEDDGLVEILVPGRKS